MKRYLFYSLSVLILFGLVAFQPKPKLKPKPVKAPKVILSDKPYDVRWDKTAYDFGRISERIPVQTTFVMTNVGKDTVFILDYSTGDGGAWVLFSRAPIAPGKSGDVTLNFDPSGKDGYSNRDFSIRTNGGTEVLNFKCLIVNDTTKSLRTLPKYHIKQDIK